MLKLCVKFLLTIFFIINSVLAEEYFWKVSLLEKKLGKPAQKASIFLAQDSVNYNQIIQQSSVLPFSGFEEEIEVNQLHIASPYILKAQVVDSMEIVQNTIMRNLVLNGYEPELSIQYLPDSSAFSDGKNWFKIVGALQTAGDSAFELASISWLYPLNYNNKAAFLQLSLPKIAIDDFVIHSKRFAFRLIKHDFLPNGNLRSFPENDFLSVSVFHSLELFGRNDFVIVSHDEFATFHVKQLPSLIDFPVFCGNTLRLTSKLLNKLLRFTNRGVFLFFPSNSSNTTAFKRIDFNGIIICPTTFSVFPEVVDDEVLVTTDNKLITLKHVNADLVDGDISTSYLLVTEVKDGQGVSVCQFLSLADVDCLVICHTFSLDCCSIFVLVLSQSSNQYILVKYINPIIDNTTAGWEILTRFYNRKPSTLSIHANNYALINGSYNAAGQLLSFLGMSEIRLARGCLFIWGNVLLVHNLKSSLNFLILTNIGPNPSPFFENQTIHQFIVERNGLKFALLTKNGDIWLGVASCCFRSVVIKKHGRNAVSYSGTSLSQVVGLFFSSHDVLYVLSFSASNSIRHAVNFTEHQSERSWTVRDCDTEFRIRMFRVRPPRLWPITSELVHSNNYIHFSTEGYNEKIFTAYRVASYFNFQNKLINVREWWLQDDDVARWYFESAGLHEYLEYLSLNHHYLKFARSKWHAYISMSDYSTTHRSNVGSCPEYDIIYLDREDTFRIAVTVETSNTSVFNFGEDTDILICVSNLSLVSYSLKRMSTVFPATYQVEFVASETDQHPPSFNLQSVSVNMWFWKSGHADNLVNDDLVLEIKVGCPPGLTLAFDPDGTEALSNQSDIFQCIISHSPKIPCITVAVQTCMSKWSNLRDRYAREKKKFESSQYSGAPAVGAVAWEHFESMGFLKDHIKHRITFTNLSNELLQDVHLRSPPFDGELDSFDSNSVCSPHPLEDSASTSLMSDLAPDSVQQSPLVAEGTKGEEKKKMYYGRCKR